ncbi:polysaccharide lyase family 7 protein [Marinomonas colpomeniae]|uniref:Polysaccharide lyase family 7 protein n=1 Tax=Marinomonas colpomeniae TaxID=2774408 RepID=A0ABR8NXY0_9GAMM|nr:polysaccharide lyase family 7 protein [Marinomonas colpomeniae]MBD5770379.1 polysaccharide lyase family 7 protein [Marinomonas colpomeniae]
MSNKNKLVVATIAALSIIGYVSAAEVAHSTMHPADKFDLTNWKITLPLDADANGKIDEIKVKDIQTYSHPDFFYLNTDNEMVFAASNKAKTTSGSSNTRSELRQMSRGMNTSFGTKSPENNFALSENKEGVVFGGKMNATLKVNHVSENAGHPEKYPAYSVVVGQIHAGKDKAKIKADTGFGFGNEPLKIYYKKWPNHQTGSVFWNYERNLEKANPDRTDIAFPVWGNTWENTANPGDNGLTLGEEFSYEVNVHGNMMYLTFSAPNKKTVKYEINLAGNIDPYGNVDVKDNPRGFAEDFMYFKAGAYNQCSTKDNDGIWYTACPGTGDWETDKANGNYVNVSFSELTLSKSTQP